MARKSKYTPEVVDRLVTAINAGATYELACGYAGIGASTFYEWINAKPEFAETIKAAEAQAALRWLARIDEASKETWQAAAWKLERRYPEMYGRQRIEHTGADGDTLNIIIKRAGQDG